MLNINNVFNAPIRKLDARVEVFEGSTLLHTFTKEDNLKSFEIERVGEGQFFGYTYAHRLNLKLLDTNRELNFNTSQSIKITIKEERFFDEAGFPTFYVSETHRDEKTNALSITAYDKMQYAAEHYSNEVVFPVAETTTQSYTVKQYVNAVASTLGLGTNFINIGDDNIFDLNYPEGANLEGSETIREVIAAIAGLTATIAYIDSEDKLTFKRLLPNAAALLSITKDDYFELSAKDARRLTKLISTTQLGENISAETTMIGSTQFLRDNPFLERREDVAAILEQELGYIGNLTITQFECDWRGNPILEIGDAISLTTKDNKVINSFLLDDTLTYDGGMSEKTRWHYDEREETASNPSTLGDALKQTYAIVDKANKKVDIVVSDVNANKEDIAAIRANTGSISASVSKLEEQQIKNAQDVNADLAKLRKDVEAKIDANGVQIAVQKELENGVTKVKTTTGFTFDENGMKINKTGSEMTTQITEDGMVVNRNGSAVLTANNEGVTAEDLHASTYMIIGNNSRFEDWGSSYTACFWIGH